MEFRDWSELPWDVLSEIFERVRTVGLFVSLQCVCRQWWRLSHDPRICRRVHLRRPDFLHPLYLLPLCNLLNVGLTAIDRGAGCLEKFTAKCITQSTNMLL